jgi:D-alanyl-D-alanine carboxypeptidase
MVSPRKKRKVRRGLPAGNAVITLWMRRVTRCLFGKNPNRQMYPASTTKVMTALLVLEKLPLDKMITVSSSALQVQENQS